MGGTTGCKDQEWTDEQTTDLLHHVEAQEVGAAGRVGRDKDVADEAHEGGERGEAGEGLLGEFLLQACPLGRRGNLGDSWMDDRV